MKAACILTIRAPVATLCLLIAFCSTPQVVAQRALGEDSAACQLVARLASTALLEDAIAKSGGALVPDTDDRSLPAARLDLDGDGRPDSAYVVGGELTLLNDQGQRVDLTPDPAIDWNNDNDFRWTGVSGFLTLEGRTYVVWSIDDALSHVSRITPQHVDKIVCQFARAEQADRRVLYSALSDYELLERKAEQHNRTVWEEAFERPGTDAIDVVLSSGHRIDERVNDESLLVAAMTWHRDDLVGWLLANGADPNSGGRGNTDTPLHVALWGLDPDIVRQLLEAGADPASVATDLEDLARKGDEANRGVLRLVIARMNYLPEQLVTAAAYARSPALADLAASGLPVQLLGVEWQAGRNEKLPSWVSRELAQSPEMLQTVTQMFAHTVPPPTRFVMATYGTPSRSWLVRKFPDSPLSDEEFLTFSTAFCVYFLSVDCGPAELVSRARAWAEGLNLACGEPLAGKVDAVACNVGTYYASVANVELSKAVQIFPLGKTPRESVLMTRANLRDLYAAKHAQP
jgi:ankyrin repeat protein